MSAAPDILCIGAVLWDVIGRSPAPMAPGDDVPGRILRRPGGVALNVAAACARAGLRPALLAVVGTDPEGAALAETCAGMGLDTRHLTRVAGARTDVYMAIESPGGLVAAVADARALELAGEAVLAPLADGRLGSASAPWAGLVALDGNLTEAVLTALARSPLLARADLRLVPASPGKAARLRALVAHPRATLYLNRAEAAAICGRPLATAAEAAAALVGMGARRVLVTDGARPVAEAGARGCRSAAPPPVRVAQVTGAGDTFLAAHVAAEARGADPDAALAAALAATAAHVSETDP